MASPEDEKKAAPTADVTSLPEIAIVEESADAALDLLEKYGHTVEAATPAQLKKVRYKLYFILLPLLLLINVWLFIDKATLSYSALLGIMEDTGLTDTEYNNLSTIFYTGYIVAQLPGHYLFQRIPLSKFVSGSIFLWSILLFLHCTASSYGGLIPLRFFLGVVEATLVPAMEATLGMFFTPQEYIKIQPIFWASCMGCPLPAGFIAYGLLFATDTIAPWKLFMIVTGSMSFILAIVNFFYFPNNPAEARFLTIEERVWVIRKVHESTKSSIEQKRFKKSQALEALRDPISWLFLLGAFTLMIANNLQFQQSLIFLKMGVGNLGSTLVSAAGGGFSICVCITATILLRLVPNKAGYWGAAWCMPAVAGGIGMAALD
ncbi:hypothetical protein PRZ48_005510 [Zasmidium cellare]|uniref:Major facilitator superfamily (MFS) profile domain-containing protein n=1 Tax=Zasmidium cellare TaxID=395010 RepID=A0ABR0ESK6_ZASCE|nr:hypothetical protein PRZ48_005510 [Zasmidium cellare]